MGPLPHCPVLAMSPPPSLPGAGIKLLPLMARQPGVSNGPLPISLPIKIHHLGHQNDGPASSDCTASLHHCGTPAPPSLSPLGTSGWSLEQRACLLAAFASAAAMARTTTLGGSGSPTAAAPAAPA